MGFTLSNYPGYRPPDTTKQVYKTPGPWNPDGWDVNLQRLRLTDCRFRNEGYTKRPLFSYFDPQHIDFNHVNAHIDQVRFSKDTLSAFIVSLDTRERSGLDVKKLTARAKFTPKAMEFRQLDVTTNRSRLRDYFAMRYDDFSA